MTHQMAIDFDAPTLPMAKAMGEIGMQRAAGHAEADEPGFSKRAQAFVLEYLRVHGVSSGELITDACKLAGIKPDEDRAFGPVYQSLLRQKKVRVVGMVPRVKGHGCVGAKLYELA